ELVYLETSANTSEGIKVRVLRFDGNSWVDAGPKGPFQPPGGALAARSVRDTLGWMSTDVDGDGRADLVHVTTNKGSLGITTLFSREGSNWVLKNVPLTNSTQYPWPSISGAGSAMRWRAMDVNGDGLLDLVRNLSYSGGILMDTLFSLGDGNWQ